MVVLKENCCRYCKKVFCCSDCRDNHENSKHPKPKCSLCTQDSLPFNPKDDKSSDLFCHIVFNHLPLRCKLCGKTYRNNQELTDAETCGWWAKQRALKEAQLVANERNSPPTVASTNTSTKLAVICEEKLPRTPEITAGENPNKPLHSSDLSSLKRLKQEQFDSPPEFARHTSTPVHGGLLLAGPKPTVSAALPQFLLKTPSSAEICKYPFNSTASTVSSVGSHTASDTESRYYTGLTSITDSRFEREKETEADPSSWNTPGVRKQQQQQQQPDSNPSSAEAIRRIERSILKPEAWSRVNESSRGDSIEKRVRFSDQCRAPADAADMDHENSGYFADNDIFFEACESLDEAQAGRGQALAKAAPTSVDEDNRRDENKVEQCSPSSSVECYVNDKSKVFKVEEGKAQISTDSSVDEKENNKPTSSTSNSSSRVLMMLLVEKSDSKGLSALDLAPLIDTGLKKLEESVGALNNNSKIVKGSHENASSSSDSLATTSRTRRLSQVSSYSRTVNGSANEDGSKGTLRASIKDSFVSISDRIECYTSTPARQPAASAAAAESPDKALVPTKSDGIFSVMARVVRNALQKLPAVATRNLSREPMPQNDYSTSESSMSAMEVLSIGSRSSVVAGSRGTCALEASQVIQLSSKRPRERLDSGEEPATSRDSPDSTGSGGSGTHQVISSPVAKRPRGWYRIKARQPIARMRQITSPRGASREVQRFQQGSLTVGDTLLPLPSRAHQSTQTEN